MLAEGRRVLWLEHLKDTEKSWLLFIPGALTHWLCELAHFLTSLYLCSSSNSWNFFITSCSRSPHSVRPLDITVMSILLIGNISCLFCCLAVGSWCVTRLSVPQLSKTEIFYLPLRGTVRLDCFVLWNAWTEGALGIQITLIFSYFWSTRLLRIKRYF